MNIIQSIAASWTGRIGLLLLVIAAALTAYASASGLPSRASLSTVEGRVMEATQITHTSTRRGQGARITAVDFQITIQPTGNAQPVKLTIPSNEITRERVVSLINERVRAEYDGERDVYALASGGKDVITYNDSWNKRATAIQVWAERGKMFFGLAIPLVLIGWPLGARKRRKQAAAAA